MATNADIGQSVEEIVPQLFDTSRRYGRCGRPARVGRDMDQLAATISP